MGSGPTPLPAFVACAAGDLKQVAAALRVGEEQAVVLSLHVREQFVMNKNKRVFLSLKIRKFRKEVQF